MTLRTLSIVALSFVTTIPHLFAQEEGDRRRRNRDRDRSGERQDEQRGPGGFRGPGGPGGFGGGMGMMGGMGGMMGAMGGGGASQLLGLLRMEEVRKEVGMTDDVYQAIQAQQQESFAKMRGLREASEEQRKEIMDELNTSSQDLLEESLRPEQQKRLVGLFVQMAGSPAVLNQMVSKELGLTKETTEAIQKELEAFGTKMRERFMAAQEGGGFPDFSKIQEEFGKMREELNQVVDSKLTEDQRKQLEEIKGEKFEFPEMGGFGRGNWGGGRGEGRGRGEGGQGRQRRGGETRS